MFGKIAVYSCKDTPIDYQSEFKEVTDIERYSYETLIQLNEETMELERDKAAVKKELDDILRHPSNSQLEADIEKYTSGIQQLESSIAELSQETTLANKVDCDRVSKLLSTLEKETKSRRKIFQNVKSIIVEQVGAKAIGDLLEDIGVKTV